MRRILLCLAFAGLIGASPQWAMQSSLPSPAQAADLERLTVPAALLPANCTPRKPDGMFRTNPAIVTDFRMLGLMHVLVFGSTPGDAAGIGRAGPGGVSKQAAEAMAARAAEVELGYAAAYEERGGSSEIGVFALRMKKPPAAEALGPVLPPAERIVKGSVAIFSWTDATPNAPDLGCVDVVRRHLAAVDIR